MKYVLMKPLLVFAVAALLSTTVVEAQQPPRPDRGHRAGPPSAEQQLARLSEALNLSDDQAIHLLEVLQNGRADHDALHERMMQDYGAEICAQRERLQEQILAVLDDEQAALFEQHRARLQQRAPGGQPRMDCSAYDG